MTNNLLSDTLISGRLFVPSSRIPAGSLLASHSVDASTTELVPSILSESLTDHWTILPLGDVSLGKESDPFRDVVALAVQTKAPEQTLTPSHVAVFAETPVVDPTVLGCMPWTEFVAKVAADGPPGPTGPQGPPGATGPAGPPGPTGATGAQGPKGDTGSQGVQGPPGSAGAAGAQGPKGDTGLAGPTGPQGAQGPPGADGAQGPQGVQGTPGAPGAKGDTGPQGPPGATGATGPQGPQGTPGATGATGATGSIGPTGATGPKGNPGEQWFSGSTAPPPPATGIVGDFYLHTTTGDVYEKIGPTTWIGVANIRGPQGTAGATGSTGAQGTQGPPGPAGSIGATGATGPQGPKGDKGDTGATGPAGSGGWPLTLVAWFVARWSGSAWVLKSSANVSSIVAFHSATDDHQTVNLITPAPDLDLFAESAIALERSLASSTGYLFNATYYRGPSTTSAQVFVFAGTGNMMQAETGMVWSCRIYRATG